MERQRGAFGALRARHERSVQLACFIYDRAVADRARAAGDAAAALSRGLVERVGELAAEVARRRELLP